MKLQAKKLAAVVGIPVHDVRCVVSFYDGDPGYDWHVYAKTGRERKARWVQLTRGLAPDPVDAMRKALHALEAWHGTEFEVHP